MGMNIPAEAFEAAARAGVRDASWFNRPNTRTPKVIHVAATGNVSACDHRVVLCDSPMWSPIYSVPLRSRCKRPACARLYLAAERSTDDR